PLRAWLPPWSWVRVTGWTRPPTPGRPASSGSRTRCSVRWGWRPCPCGRPSRTTWHSPPARRPHWRFWRGWRTSWTYGYRWASCLTRPFRGSPTSTNSRPRTRRSLPTYAAWRKPRTPPNSPRHPVTPSPRSSNATYAAATTTDKPLRRPNRSSTHAAPLPCGHEGRPGPGDARQTTAYLIDHGRSQRRCRPGGRSEAYGHASSVQDPVSSGQRLGFLTLTGQGCAQTGTQHQGLVQIAQGDGDGPLGDQSVLTQEARKIGPVGQNGVLADEIR